MRLIVRRSELICASETTADACPQTLMAAGHDRTLTASTYIFVVLLFPLQLHIDFSNHPTLNFLNLRNSQNRYKPKTFQMPDLLYRTLELVRPEDWLVDHRLLYLSVVGLIDGIIDLLLFQLLVRIVVSLEPFFGGILSPSTSRIVVDSGASQHVCPDRGKFQTYRAFRFPVPFRGAAGITWALGAGDVEITTLLKDGDNATLRLQRVFHVPKIGGMLLSTEQLRQHGIFYSSEKAVLYRRDGDCDAVIGETEIVGPGSVELRTAEETPVAPLPSVSRWSWFNYLQDQGLLPFGPRWHLFAGRPTHEEVGNIVSELEMANDKLLREVQSLKQEISDLKCSLSQPQSESANEEDSRGSERNT